ncbi:rod shape-determining protein MreC [Clostridium perfringens]|uniref:rod shape-determining protein MreC n=1 Tax=Clostridium perfringens TaxID=1502 RepID=UPI000D8938D9|nr:rod shape-determining protein MreC [Clostridium perfringens]EJT5924277.1 rod shape-determining protein MreC [Clostridium perfringens]MDH5086347.1 Cell shape-determining protein MreC precursor [Clostridium perfringens]MDK0773881.1 rod shape-determining protein MreC [Clostridium perfringens]MDK0779166.1 rod shape-determining protein MreC [Clostridium perfringens]UBK55236.1 rod shape-determining protein MreC [Clostridium perfringens]
MKFFKNKLAVTVILLSVAFLGIIIFTVKSDSKNPISGGVGTVLNPVQKVVYTISDKVHDVFDFFYNFSDVKNENNDLKKKNLELENQLVEYNELKRQNDVLRGIVDFSKENNQYKYIGTNIIGKSGNSFVEDYTIDKGSSEGIKKDYIVISPQGLVGVVTEVHSNWSKIQTLLNENVAVAATIEGDSNSGDGIVKGYRNGSEMQAEITNLPMNSTIKEGETVVTSGLGGYYPKGIRIGEVTSVQSDDVKVMKTAILKTYVDFNNLQELFVVVPPSERDGIVKY